MSTSGSTDFSVSRNDIIKSALRKIVAYAPGETPDANDITDSALALNLMIKSWQNESIGIWKNIEAALFLEDAENTYTLGPSGDHCAETFVKTELSSAAASAATSITVDAITDIGDTFNRDGIIEAVTPTGAGAITMDGALVSGGIATMPSTRKLLIYSDGDESGVTFSITGTNADGAAQTESITGPDTTTVYSTNTWKTVTIVSISGAGTGNIEVGTVGDFIGIERDSGALQWTNIGATLANPITLIDALSGAAAVDNHVYSYSAKISRPLELVEARLHRADDTEYPIDIIPRLEYMALANKTNTGSPNQIYYDAKRTNAEVRIWPAAGDVQQYILMTLRSPIEDFDSEGDNPDYPIEYAEALIWNLAVKIAPEFGAAPSPFVQEQAFTTKNNLKGFDVDFGSCYFGLEIS